MSVSLDSQLKRILNRLTDPDILRQVGEALRDIIVERVRGGQGVKSPGAPTSRLAPLSAAYIKERAKDPRLSSETSPETSNLTRHGDMLNALTVRQSGTRVSVLIPPGKLLDRAYYTNLQRPWAHISKGEATRLRDLIAKLVKQKL